MLIFAFLLGLIIGSFLNVCIYRVPRGLSIVTPPSRCPHCDTRLTPLDLVPVFSYLFLSGKCRHCKGNISPKYPLVELITGVIFALTYVRFGDSVMFLAFCFLGAVMIATFFVDLEQMVIPDEFVLTGLTGGIIYWIYSMVTGRSAWWDGLAGALTGSGIFLAVLLLSLALLKREGMGGGDIKIMAVVGLFLGFRLALLNILVSVILGGIVGFFLLVLKRKKLDNTEMPFGPFIVLSAFICIFYGNEITAWYVDNFLLR